VGTARLRLFCFSFAGGSATEFLPWHPLLAPEIELCAIQLPGRGARFAEPPLTMMSQVIDTIGQLIAQNNELPFAFFGHSLGALLAFEASHHCLNHALSVPVRLFLSGCNAPQRLGNRPLLHLLDNAALIEALKEFNGTPVEVLVNPELMRMALPALRADFMLAENYIYSPRPPLPIPITVLSGTQDNHIQSEYLADWGNETSGDCELHMFKGDHFFIRKQAEAITALINSSLAPYYLPCSLDEAVSSALPYNWLGQQH
jgi:medium-chain acyl-[acyl-carrier-protein] hydrolase